MSTETYRDNPEWRDAHTIYYDPASTPEERAEAIRVMCEVESQYPYSFESNIYA